MRARNLTLTLTWALAGVGTIAVLLAPIPRTYPALLAAAGALGAFWDWRGKHFVPRLLLTVTGALGFLASMLPLRRETLAEQSLAALTILMAIKLLERKERRDHFQILALSLMLVAGGASLAPDLSYALLFLANLLLSILLLLWLPFADQLGTGTVQRGLQKRLAVVAGVLAAGSLPLTVVFFLFLPRSVNPFWAGFNPRTQAVTGFSDQLVLGQVGTISRSQATAFRVELEIPAGPLPEIPYWRGVVLEVTDGRRWSVSPTARGFASGHGTPTVRAVYYIEPHGERELFLLEQPVGAAAGMRTLPLQVGGVARVNNSLLKPLRYLGLSRPGRVRADPGTRAERELNLRLPDNLPPRIRELAERVAAGETDPEKVARRLVVFFTSGFTYSLEIPPSSGEPLEDFLFNHRSGYCEYFASAMAILLRSRGIPARLVGGYLGGEWNPAANYYLVRQASAHTWVEAWVAGQGWVRFDPTPGSELGATLAARRAGRPRLWLDALRMRWNSWVIQYDTEAQLGFLQRTGRDLGRLLARRPSLSRAGWVLGPFVLVALLLLGLRLARRRSRDPLRRRYERFQRLAARQGFPRPAGEGPLDHARRIGRGRPGAAPAVLAFAEAFSETRYGARPVTPNLLRELDRLLKEAGASLVRKSSRRR